MEYRYKISDEYVLNDLKIDITKSLKGYMKKDKNILDYIHNYIKNTKNKFCGETKFAEFLSFYDDYFLLYNENELYAAAAISFNFNEDEDDIEGINIVYFCSKQKGYGGKLLKKIIEVCDNNNWYLKLSATENSYLFYEKYGFIKNKKDNYHYYFPTR